jgi:hypothetical protein
MTALETATRGTGTRSSTSEAPDTDPWEDISAELLSRIGGTRSPDEMLARGIQDISTTALENFTGFRDAFGGVTGLPSTESVSREGGVTVEAYWWGFHVVIPHDTLGSILDSGDTLNSTVNAIGGNIPSPAQPWIKLLAPFVAGVHQLLRSIDQGRGIYISMSWFAPGVFVPTSVL